MQATSNEVAVQLTQYLHQYLKWYYYSLTFYDHAIYHSQLTSDGPIFLYVLCYVLFFVQLALYNMCLELLQECISGCCFLYISYRCTN